MAKRMTRGVAAACLVAALLPGAASAADFYDGGDPPAAVHGRGDAWIDGGRVRAFEDRELRPAGRFPGRRAPGPVVFDERDPGRRREVPDGYGRPAPFGPRFAAPYAVEAGYADGYGYAGEYGPAPAGPPGIREGFDGPELDCTTERAQSVTPSGWRRTDTHRTCYRR